MGRTFNLSMDEELLRAVDDFAKETRRTRSEIIRWALESFLATHYPNEPSFLHKRHTQPLKETPNNALGNQRRV